jgi:hypothetical protein
MSYVSPEEYEFYTLARTLGGVSKAKELLKTLHDKNISVDNLLAYLKGIEYKVPSPLESKIEDLERRMSILEGKPPTQGAQPPPKAPFKEWSDEKLKQYLDDCKKWAQFTYQYYEILTVIDGKIGRDELIKKIRELTGKKFSGYSLAGVQAGINMSITKKNYERLDWKDEDSEQFSLNERYREKMRKYFKAQRESVS